MKSFFWTGPKENNRSKKQWLRFILSAGRPAGQGMAHGGVQNPYFLQGFIGFWQLVKPSQETVRILMLFDSISMTFREMHPESIKKRQGL